MQTEQRTCPYCDGTKVTTKEGLCEFPYGILGDVILKAKVPVVICQECTAMWLPWEAEEPIDRAVQEYRMSIERN